MSGKADFELNLPGLNELMKSEKMTQMQRQAAQKVIDIAQAGSGGAYRIETRYGYWINFVNVIADDDKATEDALDHNGLLKALQSSGLKLK